MKFLFLMDPLETVVYEKDTSFALMLGAKEKGHEVFYLPEGGISLTDAGLTFKVTHVNPQRNPNQLFTFLGDTVLTEKEVDVIFIRKDPPFDEQYLMDTWLLSQANGKNQNH